ncbi:MAG: hypothetical protein IKT52_01375 [Oscillospiraceae bacterium]|nr:hypothetical protein [Oscillospiraceae bacterium]
MDIKKLNLILMRTAAALLMLVLVTSGMVSGRFARYVTTAAYEDGARVAKFNIVEAKGEFLTQMRANIAPGTSVETISVQNYSEVAVEFTIKVESLYDNIPLYFQVWDKSGSKLAESGSVNGDLTFTGTIGAGRQEEEFQLCIHWPVDETNINYCGRVDLIQVTMDAVQID